MNEPYRRTRREMLRALGWLGTLPLAATVPLASAATRLRITVSGQALITYNVCRVPYDGLDAVIAELKRGHAVFTDLESALDTPMAGTPTRQRAEFVHVAQPDVLDCLDAMGFNLLALSNNHAWDLNTGGLLGTRAEVAKRGFAFAGTGHDVTEATRAGVLTLAQGDVALVSKATGRIRDGAAATATRAGVNELVLLDGDVLDRDDAERNLTEIARAAASGALVIAYHHNHEWGDDMARTKPWTRDWARACIDAGAAMYVSHGAPLLHGIEVYRGRPICYGLGSLIFHTRTAIGHYAPEVWESAIVHCDFADGRLQAMEIVPVRLNETGDDANAHLETRGRPRIARDDDAHRILDRLARLSAAFDTQIEIREHRGWYIA